MPQPWMHPSLLDASSKSTSFTMAPSTQALPLTLIQMVKLQSDHKDNWKSTKKSTQSLKHQAAGLLSPSLRSW